MSCIVDLSPPDDPLTENFIATALKALRDRFIHISASGIVIDGKRSHLRIVLELEAQREIAMSALAHLPLKLIEASGGLA